MSCRVWLFHVMFVRLIRAARIHCGCCGVSRCVGVHSSFNIHLLQMGVQGVCPSEQRDTVLP